MPVAVTERPPDEFDPVNDRWGPEYQDGDQQDIPTAGAVFDDPDQAQHDWASDFFQGLPESKAEIDEDMDDAYGDDFEEAEEARHQDEEADIIFEEDSDDEDWKDIKREARKYNNPVLESQDSRMIFPDMQQKRVNEQKQALKKFENQTKKSKIREKKRGIKRYP